MSDRCRLIVDPPLSGAENMRIDAQLLEEAVAGSAALRLYQWDKPTVSLGHFQSVRQEPVPSRFAGLPVVPRLSGGGAILHDRELTYSIALPATHPVSRDPSRLYDIAHIALITALAEQGVTCRMRGTDAFADQSFLCFSRGDARDIVVGSHKIVGSAQRRRQGAVLQHGSLLLAGSIHAPEFPGVRELAGVELSVETLRTRLPSLILESLQLTPQ